jgi:hypothetical protein
MTPAEMIERLRRDHPEILLADGFDDALIGVVVGACRPAVACYDHQKCIEMLIQRNGMSMDEAEEYGLKAR